jgi:serine/threonine protein kinase
MLCKKLLLPNVVTNRYTHRLMSLCRGENVVSLVALYEGMIILYCTLITRLYLTRMCIAEEQHFYFVMEVLRGGELYIQMAQHHNYTEQECIRVFTQLLRGVNAMHRAGIVHR